MITRKTPCMYIYAASSESSKSYNNEGNDWLTQSCYWQTEWDSVAVQRHVNLKVTVWDVYYCHKVHSTSTVPFKQKHLMRTYTSSVIEVREYSSWYNNCSCANSQTRMPMRMNPFCAGMTMLPDVGNNSVPDKLSSYCLYDTANEICKGITERTATTFKMYVFTNQQIANNENNQDSIAS